LPRRRGGDEPVAIPDKERFKIGEVARLAGLAPSVLRYWETEFPALRPRKSRSGQRVYLRRDVELVLHLHELVHRRGYTIDGARRALGESDGASEELAELQKELRELLQLCEG
jgi:DNA-binding transcriptional MerR regulator